MIVVKSTLNKRDAMKLNVNALKKIWWLFALISVFFIMIGVFNIIVPAEDVNETIGYVMIVLAFVFPILIIGFAMIFNKLIIKSSKFISDDMEQTFTFTDENIHIQQQSSLLKTDAIYDWSLVYKVTEFKDALYIYVSNMQSLIINTNNFEMGSLDSLKALLIIKCGKKYKSINKK